MAELHEVVTPGGARVRLALKVGVAVGMAQRFVVGDPDVQLIDVLAGQLVDDLAAAELYAEKGDVVLDRSALEALGDRVEIRETRIAQADGRPYGVVERLRIDVPEAPVEALDTPLPAEVVEKWVLPAVLRAHPHRARRVPRRAAARAIRCSCASAASTTTTTPTRSPSSTTSSATRSGSSLPTAATCCT